MAQIAGCAGCGVMTVHAWHLDDRQCMHGTLMTLKHAVDDCAWQASTLGKRYQCMRALRNLT